MSNTMKRMVVAALMMVSVSSVGMAASRQPVQNLDARAQLSVFDEEEAFLNAAVGGTHPTIPSTDEPAGEIDESDTDTPGHDFVGWDFDVP